MTEISTNEVKSIHYSGDDQLSTEDDLEPHEKYFYKSLAARLNSLQLSPKQETVFKIMAYSKFKG